MRNDRDHGPAAVALLDFLAYLDPDGFPLALLSEQPDLLPEPLRPLVTAPRRLEGALALLLRFSLLDREGDRVRVHRLVQEVTRAALPVDRRQALAAEVVVWVRAVFGYDPHEPRIGAVPAGVAAQLLALGERAECVAVAGRELASTLGDLSHFLLLRGDAATALRAGRRALAIAEDLAKADPHSAQAQRDLSVSLERLGSVEVQAGNLARARDLFARSLSLREDLAKADPHSAQAQRDLAVSCERMAQVDPPAALGWLTRAVEVRSACQAQDPTNAVVARDLGVALFQLGRAHLSAGDQASAVKPLAAAASIFAQLRRAGALEPRFAPLADMLAAAFPDA